MPKINESINVSNIAFSPNKKPDNNVTIINAEIVYAGCDRMISFIRLYHLVLMLIDALSFFCDCKMYPGIHRAENVKGMHMKIFHVEILKLCMRQNFAKIFAINNPKMYNKNIVISAVVRTNVSVD